MKHFTYDEALRISFQHNSYTRLERILQMQPQPKDTRLRLGGTAQRLSRPDFFRLLGEEWSSCDNISAYADVLDLTFRIQSPNRKELNRMMTPEELEQWKSLPDPIRAYRGCSSLNREGFCFTLDRQMAVRFATYYNRYRVGEGQTPLILTVKIPKAKTVLINGRGEREIVATDRRAVRILTEDIITPEEATLAIPEKVAAVAPLEDRPKSQLTPILPEGFNNGEKLINCDADDPMAIPVAVGPYTLYVKSPSEVRLNTFLAFDTATSKEVEAHD